MTVEAYPGFLQNDSYSAEILRRAIGSILARNGNNAGSIVGGLVGGTDCQITTASSGLKVIVGTGEIWVPGTTSAVQGGYYTRVSAAETLTLEKASTKGRIDRIVMEVIDSAYVGGSTNEAKLTVVKGSENASCTSVSQYETYKPTAPASSYTLGYVYVAGGTTGPFLSSEIVNVSALLSGSSSTIAAIKQWAGVGYWNALTFGGKFEEAGAPVQSAGVRAEGGASRAFLRGAAKVKAGEEPKAGELIATLPSGYRPPGQVGVVAAQPGSGRPVNLIIASSGEIVLALTSAHLFPAELVYFDGVSFNLT